MSNALPSAGVKEQIYNRNMAKYQVGTNVYILQSARYIRKAIVLRYGNGFYTIKFADSTGGTRLRENRLFESEEEAQKHIRKEQIQHVIKYKDWVGK